MTLTQLLASARRKCGPDVTSSGYSDADCTADLNEWLREVTGWVMEDCGRWEFNGVTWQQNLVANQKAYNLPSTMILINRVEVMYPSQTQFVVAKEIDDKEVYDALENDTITSASYGGPRYRLFAEHLELYPVPTDNVANGLSIETLDDVTELASGTDVPVLNKLIHKVLAQGAAFEYFTREKMKWSAQAAERRIFGNYEGDKKSLRYQVQMLAASKDRSLKQRFVPRQQSFR